MECFFVSDLHGDVERFETLLAAIVRERPGAVFLGGDLLPSPLAALAQPAAQPHDFVNAFLVPEFVEVRRRLGAEAPRVFLILGNDDGRMEEAALRDAEKRGVWEYIHDRRVQLADRPVFGYAYVPPTPFFLKDFERYDVGRYVDPGCISPEGGHISVPVSADARKWSTIADDLAALAGDRPVGEAIFLFHAPPYKTHLDRADLDGRMVEHVPLDVHVGSVAIRRFIEARQPRLTLHGHVHESARLTGHWLQTLGRTVMISAAHDGPELALVRFDLADPAAARRELV